MVLKKVVDKSNIEYLGEHLCEFLENCNFIAVVLVRVEKDKIIWCWRLIDKHMASANEIRY